MNIGYARVSTEQQSYAHQIDALMRAGCEKEDIYTDKLSGSKASRPEYDLVMKMLRPGDVLHVTRLDRLSRSVQQLVNTGVELRDKGIGLRVLEQGIDTTTSEGRLMFHMLSAIAEFQRDLIVANTNDGLAAARARGRVGGRKALLKPRQVALVRQMYDEVGEDGKRRHTVAEIAAEFSVSRPTIYRYLAQD